MKPTEDKSYVGMGACFFCGEPKEVILDRRLKNTLPRLAVYNREPCDECKKWMEQGVILLSVRDNETDRNNPYRTGRLCVVKDEAIKRMPVDQALIDAALKRRCMFIEDSAWAQMGLPMQDSKPEDKE